MRNKKTSSQVEEALGGQAQALAHGARHFEAQGHGGLQRGDTDNGTSRDVTGGKQRSNVTKIAWKVLETNI